MSTEQKPQYPGPSKYWEVPQNGISGILLHYQSTFTDKVMDSSESRYPQACNSPLWLPTQSRLLYSFHLTNWEYLTFKKPDSTNFKCWQFLVSLSTASFQGALLWSRLPCKHFLRLQVDPKDDNSFLFQRELKSTDVLLMG